MMIHHRMTNYRIADHRIYHRYRQVESIVYTAARSFWREFLRPSLIVATGIILAMPVARIIGSLIGG